MTVLSVDPGKRIGVAAWKDDGTLLWMVEMDFEELDDWCQSERDLTTVVVENFRNDHRTSRLKGSKNEASQVIGMLRSLSRRRGVELVEQPNGALPIAALHAHYKMPKGHLPDRVSAYLHGFYYFETQGMGSAVLRDRSPIRVS